MLISGRVPRSSSHPCASTGGIRPFDTVIIIYFFAANGKHFFGSPLKLSRDQNRQKTYLFLVKMLQKELKNGMNSVKQTKIFCKILVRKYELDNLCE